MFRRAFGESAKTPAAEGRGPLFAALADGPRMPAPQPRTSTRLVPVADDFLRQQRIVAGIDSLEMSDVFRILRTSVLQRLNTSGGTTLGITSPSMADGKTVVAANLAISLSKLPQHTVLLVDLDLRRPNLHKVFGLDESPGLADYLLGQTPLPECLVNPGIDRLVLLPSGPAQRSSSEILSSARMIALAQELKSRYPDRLVVYDMPPLLPTDDALVFLGNVDASLLVVEEGKTRRPEVQRALELLKDYRPIGTVLNKSRSPSGRYDYL
jgi:capsular exopolysaccharide synthesis family protein